MADGKYHLVAKMGSTPILDKQGKLSELPGFKVPLEPGTLPSCVLVLIVHVRAGPLFMTQDVALPKMFMNLNLWAALEVCGHGLSHVRSTVCSGVRSAARKQRQRQARALH